LSNFQKRLNESCAVNEKVPSYGRGQQTFIAREIGVSQEAVRKWFAGETMPRSNTAKKLAVLLDVSHPWLMYGTSQGELEDKIAFANRHNSAVYALMAFAMLQDRVGAAFAEADASTDLIIIQNGVAKNVSTEGVVMIEKNCFSVVFRKIQIQEGETIAAIRQDKNQKFSSVIDFIEIPKIAWVSFAKKKGDEMSLVVTKNSSGNYDTNGIKLNRFLEQ